MGQHFGDLIELAAAEQGMTDREHQSTANAELRIRPKRIKAGSHATFHRILHGNNRSITATISNVLHDRAQTHASHQAGLVIALQIQQCPGRTLSVGALRAKECHRDRHR